jgi:hypothetical protein
MVKSKIYTFSTTFSTKTTQPERKKEERGLMQRFVVASYSRPSIRLKETVPKYEFSTVPQSLFSAEGVMYLAQDKSKILQNIEKEAEKQGINVQPPTSITSKTVIIDGMAYVHSMQKPKDIKTCAEFAASFIDMLIKRTHEFDVVYLVFDR